MTSKKKYISNGAQSKRTGNMIIAYFGISTHEANELVVPTQRYADLIPHILTIVNLIQF